LSSYNWPPVTPGSGSGNITDINGDSTPSQTLAVGTSGTDFAIADGGSGLHTFNLPSASATARGVITTGTQTIAGAKTFSGVVQAPANYHIEASEHDSGNSSTAQTIDWSTGSAQLSTLTGNVTYTFTNPVAGGAYVLRIATGAGSFAATWPGNVLWPSGTAPTITVTASKVDIITFYYDGTNFYGTFAQNY
jgi:hypothetical protein